MKNKYIIALFVLASIVVVWGSLFKIIHIEIGPITGNVLLTTGMLSQIIIGVVFIIKLLFIPKKDSDFLNR